MTVGTFIQPLFGVQDPSIVKTNIQNCIAVTARLAAAFAPHEQSPPDMTAQVDPGAIWVNGALVEKAAQNSATITAPAATYSRIDRVVLDAATGVVSVITGTPIVGSPAVPAIPSGKLPVCQVALAASTTAITNSLITDERVMGGSGSGQPQFPVGYVVMNVTGVNPGTDFGYGTWAAWGTGRMPVGYDAGQTEFNASEKTGGGKTKNLAHTHTTPGLGTSTLSGFGAVAGIGHLNSGEGDPYGPTVDVYPNVGADNTGSGGSATQDVLNPYITIFMWKRMA